MSLTSAVANAAAAAAAAGQGKKAAQVQLQAELNSDDEWNKFVQRDGLLVIDVYTEWCGPCIGMVGNLKKIKVEIGGDNLHLAVAGQLVNVIFGADAPRIAKTIEQELHNEDLARKGERERPQRAPHELTPPEQEIADREAKIENDRKEKERNAIEAARFARREARAVKLESHFAEVCPALVTPHAQKNLRKITDALEPQGVLIADKIPLVLGKDGAKRLGVEDKAMTSDAVVAALTERPALALLIKKQPDKEGDVIEIVRRALCGDGIEVPEGETPKKTVSEELWLDNVPGLFVPADRHQRAAALDLLFPKMVSTFIEPPPPAEPPHVALVFGAWQRRAVVAVNSLPNVAPRVIHYGFFADDNLDDPKLLCKRIDQYEARPEKDYAETIIVMAAVGLAEPELAGPEEEIPDGPPKELIALGPLHVSEDFVIGKEECAKLFPPGYSEPEPKPKQKVKKKKKKRHEAKEETVEENSEAVPTESIDAAENGTEEEVGEGEEPAEGEGEGEEGEEPEEGEEQAVADKATSPPPLTPH